MTAGLTESAQFDAPRTPTLTPPHKGEGGADVVVSLETTHCQIGAHRWAAPLQSVPYGAMTSIMPVEVRAEYCGRYMSSMLAAGWA